MDMQYCKGCGRWFIDAQSLAQYERTYGLLMIDKHHLISNENWSGEKDPRKYNQDTVLSRNGYSTKLYNIERRNILEYLISSGESSKAEIYVWNRYGKRHSF